MKDEVDEDEPGAASSGNLPESTTSTYSNPRASRNLAEKQRRDNLNTHISLMSQLVPQVFRSPRRMDKISILRLAAAFLRTHYTVGPGSTSFLPSKYSNFDFEDYIIEQTISNEGFFFVVTGLGKIVYISRHVEEQLGHAQNELLGQSLYNYVCVDDHEELTRNLTLDSSGGSSSSSSSGTYRPSTSTAIANVADDGSNSSDDRDSPGMEQHVLEQRRTFDIRMFQRAVNKRDHRQYECLRVTGLLRKADACRSHGTNANSSKQREISSTSNDVVFVGIARLMKKRNITELSLLEASKDEYVTRHLVDGRIIYCDHRISVVAGYMTEEVSGLSAFKFMHREDVRWTMIALRQMYDRGEGFGSSCYRLLSKTGQFIYLRTHGYLEFDKNTQTVESFVCVNTLVSEKEGDELVKEMKNRFSAVTSGPAKIMVPPITDAASICSVPDSKAAVEDPQQLEVAITRLISDLPSPSSLRDRTSPSPLPNNQYLVAAMYSRGLPPASIQANQIGLTRPSSQLSSQSSGIQKWSSIEESSSSVRSASIECPSLVVEDEKILTVDRSVQPTPIGVESASPAQEAKIIELETGSQPVAETSTTNRTASSEVSAASVSKIAAVETIVGKVSAANVKAADSYVPEKRTSRKRATKSTVDRTTEERAGSTMTINNVSALREICQESDIRKTGLTIVSSSCETVGRPSVVCQNNATTRDATDLTSVSGLSRVGHRGKPESMQEYLAISKEPRYKLKRSRDLLVETTSMSCKRKISENYLDTAHASSSNNDDDDDDDDGMTSNPGTYYDNANDYEDDYGAPILTTFEPEQVTLGLAKLPSPTLPADIDHPINDDRATCSLESPSGCLPAIDLYQNLNCASLDSDNSHQLEDLQDVPDDMLSSALETNPDLMEMFRNLPPGVDIEQTIDNMNVDQFGVKDQAVNIEVGRVHSHIEDTITQREKQFDAMKSDLENPVLPQAHRDGFFQLQAEHNEAKEILKTLQQDRNKFTAQYGTACNATLVYENRYPKNSHADISLHFS